MVKKLCFLLLLLIFGALFFLWINRVPLAEDFLSKKLGAKVTLEELNFGWSHLLAKGVKVSDPALESTFTIGSVRVDASPTDLLANPIRIRKLELNSVKLDSNIGKIDFSTNGLLKATKIFEKITSKPVKKEETGSGKHVQIDQFLATDIDVQIAGAVKFRTPKVQAKDISTDLNKVVQRLAKEIKIN